MQQIFFDFSGFQPLDPDFPVEYTFCAKLRLQRTHKTKQPSRLKAAFLLGNFMQQITITVGDDGTMSVETSEGGEPYQCKSADECMQYVGMILKEESGESPQEQATEGPENYGQMWQQEAQKRQPQPGLMA